MKALAALFDDTQAWRLAYRLAGIVIASSIAVFA
jgi:hypothetical protein